MKICSKCKIKKSKNKFNKDKTKKDGLQTYCKKCQKQYKKQWYKNNPKYNE